MGSGIKVGAKGEVIGAGVLKGAQGVVTRLGQSITIRLTALPAGFATAYKVGDSVALSSGEFRTATPPKPERRDFRKSPCNTGDYLHD